MKNTQTLNRNFEAISWGALFLWWGTLEMFKGLPAGTGAIGIGLILLGLNGARYFSKMATSSFSITLGFLALIWGALEFGGAVLNLPFELPFFAILLVALGMFLLIREIARVKNS
jgi:hypothetical protein